jgi:glucosamine kinase
MKRLFFIGVDGGGTRCRARLQDEAGTTLGEGVGGPANVRRDARLALHSVLAASGAALSAAGLDENVIGRVHAGLGLAGAGQRNALERFAGLPHPFASVSIETDAYAAWLGVFGGADGAVLIAGTGSCGLAIVRGKGPMSAVSAAKCRTRAAAPRSGARRSAARSGPTTGARR